VGQHRSECPPVLKRWKFFVVESSLPFCLLNLLLGLPSVQDGTGWNFAVKAVMELLLILIFIFVLCNSFSFYLRRADKRVDK
jgi:hypothetical protein